MLMVFNDIIILRNIIDGAIDLLNLSITFGGILSPIEQFLLVRIS